MSYQHRVRAFYKPFYDSGDEAHKIEHADDVYSMALKLNDSYDEKLITLAAYIHDIFNATNRKEHHKLAYEYVLKAEDKFLKELNKEEIKLVAYAVLEHRASYKGEFYSLLSEIISGADRGLASLKDVIIRSCKYNNGNYIDVYEHIKDKYATKGYANYPQIIEKKFSKELENFKKECDELTLNRVIEVCLSIKN